ncbi:hypothetical protein [Streptomyces jumonjinensis]|uniref:hypothetical protein n=1 Tax=Streptomyces jumonjinensis TaxID=1945 RepID=UPI0037A64846
MTQGLRYESPECRQDECTHCDGPGEIRLQGQSPAEPPVFTIRGAHPCHTQAPAQPGGNGPSRSTPAGTG